jgi:hypothetical protein
MTVRFFAHTKSKRAEALALVDSGATENFINLDYARYLRLPVKCWTVAHASVRNGQSELY